MRFDALNLCGKAAQELRFTLFRRSTQINRMLPFAFGIIKTDRARHGFPPTFFAQVHTGAVQTDGD